MKSMTNIVGIILLVFGIVCFVYSGFSYTTQEQVAEIGSVSIVADKEKTVPFSPMLGGVSIAAGVVLLIVGRKRR